MRGNDLACFKIVMREEGGSEWSRERADPGNWTGNKCGVGKLLGTKYGVSAPVACQAGLIPETLTEEQALNVFFRPNYWAAVGGDQLRAGEDLVVVDDAYNAGPGRAKTDFARAGGGRLPVDETISKFSASRLAFLRGLRTWRTFGAGWARRVARVEADAHRMAKTPAATVAIHAAAARSRATANAKTALMAPTTATAGAGMTSTNLDAMPPSVALALLGGLVVVGAVVTAVAYWKWRAHGARVVALEQLSEELHNG